MNYLAYLQTPCGWLEIQNDGSFLLSVHFVSVPNPASVCMNSLGKETQRLLAAYFAGERVRFDLPLAIQGTPFQQAVWRQLQTIAYGQTCSYGQLAVKLGKPGAARAVGQVCHVNPWGIVVPCHRVVGAQGQLTGYAGGLNKKQWLLQWEKSH